MPPGDPVLGHLRQIRTQQLAFMVRCCVEQGDVVRLYFGNRWRGLTAHLCSSPETIRHVLQDNHRNYHKGTRGFDTLKLVLGNGLLTSDGDFWLRQRRIAQPAFHRDRIASFASSMVRAADELVERRWRGAIERGEALDVASEMMRVTLRIVGETMLSIDPSDEADRVGEALSYLLMALRRRTQNPLAPPLSWRTPGNQRLKGSIAEIDRVVLGIIEQRRKGPATGDLLSMLMEARDEDTGERMSDQQLRDEVVTMFLAGHETTALALSWCFYLLSMHPEVGRKLRAELSEVLGDRLPTFDDVPRLVYTRMVLQETMRLYPPAWTFGRTSRERDVLDGYEIPAGSLILISPYVVHRNPRLWANAEGFDPERFSADNAGKIPKFGYIPFGAGPRQCIGNSFAMMEATLVLATIASRVELSLVPGRAVVAEPTITLRPGGGLWMQARAARA